MLARASIRRFLTHLIRCWRVAGAEMRLINLRDDGQHLQAEQKLYTDASKHIPVKVMSRC